jgi:hypothetical protein
MNEGASDMHNAEREALLSLFFVDCDSKDKHGGGLQRPASARAGLKGAGEKA